MGREQVKPDLRGQSRACAFAAACTLTLALMLMGGIAHAAPTGANQHTIVGYLSLQEAGGYFLGPCHGTGGYADIDQGTHVTVRDESGDVIGEAHFGVGKPTGSTVLGKLGFRSACVFKFVVRNVPIAATYTFEVSSRGGVTYTYTELAKTKWKLGAVLGD
jgi:hypothetical protein